MLLIDYTMIKIYYFRLTKIASSALMVKSGRAENSLDVLTKYLILGFCRLD
jgi:hypothetical protein